MSEIYIQEPPTAGRVLIRTTKGELIVDLWSRECPQACRNFVQLCMEGYYHGCIFHRIIQNFLIQTGDPAGLGTTCESIFGEPFPDEFHSRLRYRYRGMVGVANTGEGGNTNGSQFFITLQKQESLNGQHTLFGKVAGDSVYALGDIASVDVDRNDRPLGEFPPMIMETVVLDNPFPDISPRVRKPVVDPRAKPDKVPKLEEAMKPRIAAKFSKTLSFMGNESDDGDGAHLALKSAHDLQCGDKTLSSESFVARTRMETKRLTSEHVRPVAKTERKQEVSEPEQKQTDMILSEIEKVKAAIRAAEAKKVTAGQDKQLANKRASSTSSKQDDQIIKKLKSWSEKVGKSDKVVINQSETEATRNDGTLSCLLNRAEEGASISGSGWLKNVGPVKFAIDSRNAYNR